MDIFERARQFFRHVGNHTTDLLLFCTYVSILRVIWKILVTAILYLIFIDIKAPIYNVMEMSTTNIESLVTSESSLEMYHSMERTNDILIRHCKEEISYDGVRDTIPSSHSIDQLHPELSDFYKIFRICYKMNYNWCIYVYCSGKVPFSYPEYT